MDPTVLCLPKDTPKVRNTGRNARHFCFSLSVCLYFFVEFVCRCPDPHLDPKRTQGPENVRFHRFPARTSSPFGGAFGAPFRHIFFSGLRDTQKGGPGGPSKLDPFFGRFGDLPGGPQEGSHVHGSSIFTFAAGFKKGSKMGAKMEPFGLPDPSYTNFGAPFVRN